MDSISCIKKPITKELESYKTLFDSSLSSNNPLLNSVIAHVCQSSGKMMRPILLLLVSRLYGHVNSSTLHAAVSLELLHTASLVHDDVVDESKERRGQLSVNAIYNNKVAVLSGDFLLATSLVHAGLTMNHDIIQVVSTLGQELADGELLQLSNISNVSFSEEIYFDVIRKKTAALFSACTQAAAYSMNVSPDEVERVRLLGEYIGICFQIKDDIFDYFENKELGKPTGNDMLEGKLTLPALYVLNHTSDDAMCALALRVKRQEATAHDIALLIQYVKDRGGIDYAVCVMKQYKQKALDLLDTFLDCDVRAALHAYLDYVVERRK